MARGEITADVFIAGGGPAGLATAIALRNHGLSVVVADFAKPPIDKTCGEGLMPQTVATLKSLGVTMGPAQAVPFHGIRFIGEGRSATGAFPEGYGLGVRRTTLHAALVNRAEEVAVRLLWATRVTKIEKGKVSLDSGNVSCRWIVGADGQNSQVRKWAGLDCKLKPEMRLGFRQHFRVAPWTEFVEVHWGRDCQIVVTPVTPEQVCLAVTSRSPQLRLAKAISQFPDLAKRLEGFEVLSKDIGAISTLRVLRKVCRGQVALVGDASGSVDSLTGEGLGLAFQHADALADAVAHDNLALYETAHRCINRPLEVMSRLLLTMENRPWLRHRVFDGLSHEPKLFGRLLAVHEGSESPLSLGFNGFFKLGWRLLANPS